MRIDEIKYIYIFLISGCVVETYVHYMPGEIWDSSALTGTTASKTSDGRTGASCKAKAVS